jgi:hypothetical protein
MDNSMDILAQLRKHCQYKPEPIYIPRRKCLWYALLAFEISFILSGTYQYFFPEAKSDFYHPMCSARALLNGADPYGPSCHIYHPDGRISPLNPMTTILLTAPFSNLGLLGYAMIWGLINSIMVYGFLSTGAPWKLLSLLSAPYFISFYLHQWSPLLVAVALLPSLLPLALVKPQLGIPIILTNLTKNRIIGCVLFIVVTLVIDPTWPFRWWRQVQGFDGYIPLLTIPFGPLLILSLLRWREKSARFFLFMSLVPQRWIYDLLPLWLLVRNPAQSLALTTLSWFGLLLVWPYRPEIINVYPLVNILFVYLPLLAILIMKDHEYNFLNRVKNIVFGSTCIK